MNSKNKDDDHTSEEATARARDVARVGIEVSCLNDEVYQGIEKLRGIKLRYPELRVSHQLDFGSILNAYREGDLSFEAAVGELGKVASVKRDS